MPYTGGAGKIAAILKLMIDEVGSTDNVLDYMPMARDWKQFLSHFESFGMINGWCIERKSTRNEWLTSDQNLWTHSMIIRGYFGVNDGNRSGRAFSAMVDDVVNKFDGEKDLRGHVEEHQPAQVRTVDHRMFGGVLVHYCEIELICQERITRLPGGGS